MGVFRLWFLVVCALYLAPSTKGFCNNNLQITGGHRVTLKDVPFIASINEVNENAEHEKVCAGSVIHERFILTAASCIDGDKTKVRSVRVATDSTYISVTDSLCHEQYDAEALTNDICLLKLGSTVPFAKLIQVALPEKNLVLEVGTLVNATGWGATHVTVNTSILKSIRVGGNGLGNLLELQASIGYGVTIRQARDGNMEAELHQVLIPVLRQKCCDEIYDEFNANQICAGARRRDFCEGDMGGPLTHNSVQVGVISGDGECGTNPGIYTRITSYLAWISSTINNNL